jgi:hypothetical protein
VLALRRRRRRSPSLRENRGYGKQSTSLTTAQTSTVEALQSHITEDEHNASNASNHSKELNSNCRGKIWISEEKNKNIKREEGIQIPGKVLTKCFNPFLAI